MICLPTDSTWPAATTADWLKKQNCGCRPPTCTQHISLVMHNRIMRRLLGISMEQADSEQLRQKAKNVTSRYKGQTLSASSAECECYVNFFKNILISGLSMRLSGSSGMSTVKVDFQPCFLSHYHSFYNNLSYPALCISVSI